MVALLPPPLARRRHHHHHRRRCRGQLARSSSKNKNKNNSSSTCGCWSTTPTQAKYVCYLGGKRTHAGKMVRSKATGPPTSKLFQVVEVRTNQHSQAKWGLRNNFAEAAHNSMLTWFKHYPRIAAELLAQLSLALC